MYGPVVLVNETAVFLLIFSVSLTSLLQQVWFLRVFTSLPDAAVANPATAVSRRLIARTMIVV